LVDELGHPILDDYRQLLPEELDLLGTPVNVEVADIHSLVHDGIFIFLQGPIDEGRLPFLIGGHKHNLLEGDAPRILAFFGILLKPDVEIHYFKLQVIDGLLDVLTEHSALVLVLLQLVEKLLEAVLGVLLNDFSFLFGICVLLIGKDVVLEFEHQKDVVQDTLDRHRADFRQRHLDVQFADRAVGQPDRDIQLVEEFVVEADVLDLEVSTEDVHCEVVLLNALDELPEVAQNYFFSNPFKHLIQNTTFKTVFGLNSFRTMGYWKGATDYSINTFGKVD
jgi:hypothetical protein